MDVALLGLEHWLKFSPLWYTPALGLGATLLVALHYYVFTYGLTAILK